ncbi:HNH endonuclease [Sorangium sp. So ce1128]
MDTSLVALVTQRANAVCEYCQLPQSLSSIPFEIDHIIAQKHGGVTVPENLGFACLPGDAALAAEAGEGDRLPGHRRRAVDLAGAERGRGAVAPEITCPP